MDNILQNFTFNKLWNDISIDEYEGYNSKMSNYHMHDYYEISIIISGNVSALTDTLTLTGETPKILLFPPKTAHFVKVFNNKIYKRVNVLFSKEFINSSIIDGNDILSVFKSDGNILSATNEEVLSLSKIVYEINSELNVFRKKLLLFYLISKINDIKTVNQTKNYIPEYVISALKYVNENYQNKITAENLAYEIGIGRTTLLTALKRYTGNTLNEHITKRRIQSAIDLLNQGYTETVTAELCGFNEASNLIRAFKRILNKTPKQYLK